MPQPLTLRTEVGDEHLELDEFEARVRKGDVSPQCLVRFPAVTGEAFVPACELEVWRSVHEPRRAHFGRTFGMLRFPWVTTGLIAVNLAVHLWSLRGGPLDMDAMVKLGGKAAPLITDTGELWRLVTANFFHWNLLHLGVNLFVLFNVGGALENAYRRWDYVFLLMLSGVCSMAASVWWSPEAVTAGASGMVYGALGGLVIFGLKYRTILPTRYRRVLGEAAVPLVLLLFLMGFASPGVDNAAHLGGLLAGLGVAPLLRPRLLAEGRVPEVGFKSKLSPFLRAMPSAVLVVGVVGGGAVTAELMPGFRTERDDTFGISVGVPTTWRPGANRFGQLAFFNGLPGAGRATFAAGALVDDEPADVAAFAKRFIDEQLRPEAMGGEVLQVRHRQPVPARIGDRDAVLVRAEVDEPFGRTELFAYFVARGTVLYQLVFSYPTANPRYARLVEGMAQSVRLDEPKALREARAKALLFPQATWSLAELGSVLTRVGDPHMAAEALGAAVKREPGSVRIRAQWALALLYTGELERGCTVSEEALLYGPEDVFALEIAARCELLRGNPARALERILQARAVSPGDVRLKRAEAALRSAVAK